MIFGFIWYFFELLVIFIAVNISWIYEVHENALCIADSMIIRLFGKFLCRVYLWQCDSLWMLSSRSAVVLWLAVRWHLVFGLCCLCSIHLSGNTCSYLYCQVRVLTCWRVVCLTSLACLLQHMHSCSTAARSSSTRYSLLISWHLGCICQPLPESVNYPDV